MTGRLELRPEGFGQERHFLDGEPLHCGDMLEWRADDGQWTVGRYEWNPRAGGDAVLITSTLPDGTSTATVITHEMTLRWPLR